MLKVTNQLIFDELARRGVKVEIFNEAEGILRYFWRDQWQLLLSSCSLKTSAIGHIICRSKTLSANLAMDRKVPTPATIVYQDFDLAIAFLEQHKRLVVKPADAAHGDGVTLNVTSAKELRVAYELAVGFSDSGDVIIQEQVGGDDYRILVIDGKFVAACNRVPARVYGDGRKTILELIKQENQTNNLRGQNYQTILNVIDIKAAERYLGAEINAVPNDGQEVQVVGAANIGTGGESVDATDVLPAKLIAAAERMVEGLQIMACGVDFIYDSKTGAYNFIELNSVPSFGLHVTPLIGQPRLVHKQFVDSLLA